MLTHKDAIERDIAERSCLSYLYLYLVLDAKMLDGMVSPGGARLLYYLLWAPASTDNHWQVLRNLNLLEL